MIHNHNGRKLLYFISLILEIVCLFLNIICFRVLSTPVAVSMLKSVWTHTKVQRWRKKIYFIIQIQNFH